MLPTLRGGLIAGAAVGALTVVLVAVAGAFAPYLSLCFLWALGLAAGFWAVRLAQPAQPTHVWQVSGVAGLLAGVGDYVGQIIGALLLRYVVYPSGLIPADYLPASVNVPPLLFFVRDLCVCGIGEASIILVFSLLGGWLAQRLGPKPTPSQA